MKVLNLYAGVGGNRTLWEGVEVTAVEHNAEVAAIYQERFPQDEVIVGDAHEYLIEHHAQYEFVWSSPPCQTHSQLNIWGRHANRRYPDMSLYQEILWLRRNHKGGYAIENVVPYYGELIPAQRVGRHLFWSNFHISAPKVDASIFSVAGNGGVKPGRKVLEERLGIELGNLPVLGDYHDPLQVLRNCCHPEIGRAVLESYTGEVDYQGMQQCLV